ncbi:MAG TPA: hypothetical protein VGO52_19955 [Hyphomonadaceae bacterium]|nr:hypothetical protein [Hyphomonadaceae bacterium]
MTFTWLNKQGVRSSEGFELQFTDRFKAEYRENGRTTQIHVETSGGNAYIDEESIDRLAGPFESLPPGAGRERIIRNLREALAFQGLTLVVG